MQGLIQFFLRNGQVFLFLLLEAVALFSIIRFNRDQQQGFALLSTAVAARVYRIQQRAGDFVGMRQKVNELARENAGLRRALYEQKLQLRKYERLQPGQEQSSGLDSSFQFTPARVLSNSIARRNNFLTLDKGARHGIRPGMGVITHRGVVGVVTGTTPNFSRVMSMLHSQFRLSAGILGTDYFGTLLWPGGSSRRMELREIPIHARIEPGDTVVTSGYSFTFPAGIEVGTLKEVEQREGSYFFQLPLTTFQKPGNLHTVYVVDHPQRQEWERLNSVTDP